MSRKLAIVIPAYKIQFLQDCLKSIAEQTNRNFKLYIGNDNSPYEIEQLVDKFRSSIDISYEKFSVNLGRTSLVKHWERCIEMIEDEKWIWLFSDDDVMDKGAVEGFYQMRPISKNIYRFNLNIIDGQNNHLGEVNYSNTESVASFLGNRLKYNYTNVISNYIFSREIYKQVNGFVEFPLAWGSDDASIIQFAERGEILLIKSSRVSWRDSGTNISMIVTKEFGEKKIFARIAFVKWLFNEKFHILEQIENDKKIVAEWFMHALKIEYAWSSEAKKYQACLNIYPLVGHIIFKLLLIDRKNKIKTKVYNLLKRVK